MERGSDLATGREDDFATLRLGEIVDMRYERKAESLERGARGSRLSAVDRSTLFTVSCRF